jgi:hypothetical protein
MDSEQQAGVTEKRGPPDRDAQAARAAVCLTLLIPGGIGRYPATSSTTGGAGDPPDQPQPRAVLPVVNKPFALYKAPHTMKAD